MPLSAGDKLGPYEILASIGAGGMGEVYRARDARLNRDVAIKVSGEQFSERFESEAKAIAALNHPNICQIYDVGPDFLVMEYIDGRPIVDCEQPQALPPNEALQFARQIAAALETAHGKGIIHRDLKSATVNRTLPGSLLKCAATLNAQNSWSREGFAPPKAWLMPLRQAVSISSDSLVLSA
jgi:eukaryotic-like serine/threonine-protein kinase